MALVLQAITLIVVVLLTRRIGKLATTLDALDRRLADVARTLAASEVPQQPQPPPQTSSSPAAAEPSAANPPLSSPDWVSPWAVAAARAAHRADDAPAAPVASPAAGKVDRVEPPSPASPSSVRPPLTSESPVGTRHSPRPDFELRFGRRWAALLGGGIVAFGFALLVRHSIQQGYFPPAVRLGGAALLALALCAAAEFFRKRGTFAVPVDASRTRRMADIPSILLGTGLAGIFSVSYAAHAVYEFLGVVPAFVFMASAALAGIAASLVYGPALGILGYLAALGVPFLVVGGASLVGAGYVALVGVAGYAAIHRGRWPRLENPAGLVLLTWAFLLRNESLVTLSLVAIPAAIMAAVSTVTRLRPRVAWSSRKSSLPACLALALIGGHGMLVATHFAVTPSILGYEPAATILGLVVLLLAFAFAATSARGRPVAPFLAAALLGVIAILASFATRGSSTGLIVVGLTPFTVWATFTVTSIAVLVVTFMTLHRTSLRSPTTTLVGTISATAFLVAGDLILHATGGTNQWLIATLALVQGAALVTVARPTNGSVPATRDFGSVIAASVGIGLIGLAAVVSGLGEGSLVAFVLAMTAAGAAGLAVAWRTPLFATVSGMAAIPVILQAGIEAVRTAVFVRHGYGTSLTTVLQSTLLPGLVLLGAVFFLRRLDVMAVRAADRRWLTLLGARESAGRDGQPASTVVAATAAGALLLGALVATVRTVAYGEPYAAWSAPTDIGLACTFALSGAVASLRLHRATSVRFLGVAADLLAKLAMPILFAALLANPFVTRNPVGGVPLLNLLLLAYLVPALVAWRLARDLARSPSDLLDRRLRDYAGAMAVAGLLAWVTFSVSQLFQGSVLSLARVTEAELWTHTATWLGLGVAILGYGIRVGARVVRLTALGIVAAVAVKVTFVDLAYLTGAARALSVMALGLVLLGIGMAYQRLAAREAGPAQVEPV